MRERLSVSLFPKTAEWLRARAAENGVTVSSVVEGLVRDQRVGELRNEIITGLIADREEAERAAEVVARRTAGKGVS